jgi:hypothetical protein
MQLASDAKDKYCICFFFWWPLLEEHCPDFTNKIQKQRAQVWNNFIKKKRQILETEIDNFWLNISYHQSLACWGPKTLGRSDPGQSLIQRWWLVRPVLLIINANFNIQFSVGLTWLPLLGGPKNVTNLLSWLADNVFLTYIAKVQVTQRAFFWIPK